MNKPRITQPEPHAPIWSRRIFEALQRKRMTQDKLSELAEVARASLSSWIWGNSSGIYTEPKAEGLKNIARVLGVSTDYLLGLSDIPTSDITVKGICEGTGLSVEAVKKLSGDFLNYRNYKDVVSKIIAHDNFSTLVNYVIRRVMVEKEFETAQAFAMGIFDKKKGRGSPDTEINAARYAVEDTARRLVNDIVDVELKKPADEIENYPLTGEEFKAGFASVGVEVEVVKLKK